MNAPEVLTVLYDADCELCRRCHHWLAHQPTYVPLRFLASGSPEAKARYGAVPWLGAELVVVDEHQRVWIGPAAFLMCLWATKQWRHWSYRLSGRAFAPLAERFFHLVSSNRKRIGKIVGSKDCPNGRCRHRPQPAWTTPPFALPPRPSGWCQWCGNVTDSPATHCHRCGSRIGVR